MRPISGRLLLQSTVWELCASIPTIEGATADFNADGASDIAHLDNAGFAVEIAHLVVQQKTSTRNNSAQTVTRLESERDRHRHAACVDDRVMRRLVTLVGLRDLRRCGWSGFVGQNRFAQRARVLLAHQTINWCFDEIGIAEEAGAIKKGTSHRFGNEMHVLR